MLTRNPTCIEPEAEAHNSQVRITELVEQCLRSNPYLALKTVSCDWLDGVLVLRGCLPSYYLKQIAQEAVASLEGVERIDNQIQVVTPADHSGRRNEGNRCQAGAN
jgi:osmotically-inducible protein OsmY